MTNRQQVIWRERLIFLTLGVAFTHAWHVATQPLAEKLAQADQVLVELQRINEEVTACLPADLYEQSVITLVDEDGVLKLACAKSEINGTSASYQNEQAAIKLAMPISVE